MPIPSTSRSRASLALGTTAALFAASLSIGINPASANGEDQPVSLATVEYAVVSGHAPQSSIANKPSYWCADGWKIEGKDLGDVRTYLLPEGTYSRVIVKAGSGPTANTIFAAPPMAGQTVWADFVPSVVGTNEGPKDGDKTISHIIVCPGPNVPEKTDLTVTKVWAGDAPEDFLKSLTSADAGSLSVTVDGEPILEPAPEWGSPIEDLPVGVKAEISEGEVPALPRLQGYSCKVTGSPEYSVNDDDFDDSASFDLQPTSNTVKVRNTVACSEDEKPTTSLKVIKQWVPGNGVPAAYPKLDSDDAGTLTVTVNDDPTKQSWNDTKVGLPIGGSAVVSESKPALPPFAGYECTVSNPNYVVNGGSTTDAAAFELSKEPNTVTVVNAFDCTALIIPPPTTSITVTKSWAYVGVQAPATTPSPGALTVTVGGTATGQAWGAVTSGHTVGATATVTEAAVTPPPVAGYTCTADAPSYVVNGGSATTTAPSFALVLAPNTVTVTNTVRCALLPVVDEVEDEVVEEDTTEEAAVAGEEDELAATGGNTSAALLGALLVLSGAALIGSRRRFGMNS